MRFYIVLFFCSVCFFISCGPPSGDAPDGMLTMPQMANVLTDIHIVDGNMANMPMQPDTLVKHGMALYLQVFKIHHTDSVMFRKSLRYYTDHPDVLLVIYEGVNRRLKKKQDSLLVVQANIEKLKRKDPHFKADSIKAKNKADSLEKVRVKHVADSIKKAEIKTKAELKKLAETQKALEKKAKRNAAGFSHAPKSN